jgi:hypothetical protein
MCARKKNANMIVTTNRNRNASVTQTNAGVDCTLHLHSVHVLPSEG